MDRRSWGLIAARMTFLQPKSGSLKVCHRRLLHSNRCGVRVQIRRCQQETCEATSEEHTSELHHLGISYAVFCLKKKKTAAITLPAPSLACPRCHPSLGCAPH